VSSDLTDQRLGEFHLLRHLGSGGMADVFLAEQTSLQRYVAVKVMKPSMMKSSGQDMLARFKQEAMMAAGLNHPNIVQVYTVGEQGDLHYIAQEFVQGRDLGSIIRDRGKPDLTSALHVMRQVAAALKASGQAGIVHRDIKPENILVTRKGEVKVADFGLAQLGDRPGSEKEGVTMGTPLYMSPEQVSGRELDPRSDIYSFGVTCYQLLCGETPFRGPTAVSIAMQHLKNPPPPLKEKNPALPDIVCRMVHRMMAKRRMLRYQSADEVLEDLKKLITAHKQGRSLDLIRLPRLEELEKLSEQERAKFARVAGDKPGSSAPRFDEDGLELTGADPGGATAVLPGRWSGQIDSGAVEVVQDVVPVSAVHSELDDDPPPLRKRKVESESIDLTPAVDVTFQLLIFFMITASFSMQKAFDVPPATNADGASTQVVIESANAGVKVEVDGDNKIYIDAATTPVTTYDEVLELLNAAKGRDSAIVEVNLFLDPDSTHEMRVMVIDAATQAGFLRVSNKIQEM
jgi:serine/threonine protein kinase